MAGLGGLGILRELCGLGILQVAHLEHEWLLASCTVEAKPTALLSD